ncbi:MAG: PaaI family thioesterase [Phascolarctobacterium sp.]|nr:PaaI family thioesterase [Phascolarctobacterium sp.]
MNEQEILEILHNRCEQTGWRKLCGIKVAGIKDKKLTLSMLITEDISNAHAIAHGGAISGLLDTVMGLSCMIQGKNVVTMNLNINFIRGAKTNTLVYATADIIHVGRTSIITEAKCFDDKETLYATATGTFYVLRNREQH